MKVVLTSQTSVAFVATRHRAAVEAHLAGMPGMETA
jgi:DNA polymerase-2